jgi:hypothetical protein
MKNKDDKDLINDDDAANRDPITNAPGAHPIGVGVGATGGAAAGAAIGSMAGPVGTAVGAVVGGVAGGLAGKGAAESVNPTVEDAYWRQNYSTRPYIDKGADYEAYRPAYRYGWESYDRHAGKSFDEVEPQLSSEWETRKGSLGWSKARGAVRDAWERVDERHGSDR